METLAVLPFAEECPCPTVVPSGVGFACLCHRQNVRERERERDREKERGREKERNQKGVPIRRATQKSDSSWFRVSGFGFRVSSIETNFRCRFRVSGFGFRVSSIETHFRCRFRVSGFDRPGGS